MDTTREPVLVLGIGNILMCDEGIGVHVVRTLERQCPPPPGAAVLDGGTSGMDLLDTVADRDHLIIVDAVRTGDPPGTVVLLRDAQVPAFFRTKISPHQLGVSDLLAALALMGRSPVRLTLIGVVPASLDTGLTLSATVAARLPRLVALTAAEVADAVTPPARTGTAG